MHRRAVSVAGADTSCGSSFALGHASEAHESLDGIVSLAA